MMKKLFRNEKGLTLVELLVVVVILGIIVAIAIPTIGGILDNTKKDAHIANAQQLVGATKLYMTAENVTVAQGGSQTITLQNLISNNYMENVQDPSSNGLYHAGTTQVVVTNSNDGYQYVVTIRGGSEGNRRYINGVNINSLTRDNVDLGGNAGTPANSN